MLTEQEIAMSTVAMRERDIRLDGSLESLGVLDEMLKGFRQALQGSDEHEAFLMLTALAGSYFGEVLRQGIGGKWQFSAEGWMPALACPGCQVSPFGRVRKFLEEGPENSLYDLAIVLDLLSQVAQELEVDCA